MFVSRDREKLIHAIVFFCLRTKHCHTLKLFKLLNFLDVEHYRQTGTSVTGLRYYAWEKGPVPRSLWHEFRDGVGADLRSAVTILAESDHITKKIIRRDIKPRLNQPNLKLFSKREIEIMERLAFLFADVRGDDMSEFSHGRGLPWREVFNGEKEMGKLIPDILSLEAKALNPEIPTIDKDELEYREELLKGTA